MTDELVNSGKILVAIVKLTGEVKTLSGHVLSLSRMMRRRMPCLQDTDPDTPRAKLASMSDEEPDSVVRREISVHAGPFFSFRGPAIIGILSFIGGCLTLLAAHHWLLKLW